MGGVIFDPHSMRSPRDSGSSNGNSAGPAGAQDLLARLRRGHQRRQGGGGRPASNQGQQQNRADYDPLLKKHAGRIEDRLDNHGQSTGRAIDTAVGRIRDLGYGQKRAGAQHAAARGVLGTSSIPGFQNRQIDAGVRSAGAGAAADIALGRERDYDSLLLGSTSGLAAPGEAARADRAGARADKAQELNAWATAEDLRIRQQQAQMAEWMNMMQMALNL